MKQQKKIHRIYLATDLKSDMHKCSMDLSHRILNVLRIKNNETISIFNNKGQECLSRVSIEGKQVILNLSKQIKSRINKSIIIRLCVSIINMKLMDLIIQKSVELGVTNFIPIYTQRSQYKNVDKKLDHWEKTVIHATEQCGRLDIMKLSRPVSLSNFDNICQSSSKYLLHQNGDKFKYKDLESKDITLLVGPEGGFDDLETDYLEANGWKMKTINVNILRTETACISALTLLNNYDIFSRRSL